MVPYAIVLAAFGALVLLTAWLPMVVRRLPLSLPIVCLGIGAALSLLPAIPEAWVTPHRHPAVVERATELVVVVALMGAGLKLDRPIGWASWATTWRLLAIAMPLSIAALGGLAASLLGLGLATSLLLAASLAPTDPVLASDVQVGPPGEGQEDEARFSLTSEAGLNDGLAFPFVNLALLLAAGASLGGLGQWALVDVAWKIGGGILIGFGIGRVLGWLTFHLPNHSRLSRSGVGFVALGITCVTYGVTEIAHAYGFVAVFVAALVLRSTERDHTFHLKLHDFVEELERLLMMILLVGLGAALVGGGLLSDLSWSGAVFAALAIFVVRPLCAGASLLGSPVASSERGVIAFFGIRGLGTMYYLGYAFSHGAFEETPAVWSAAAATVALSIVLHGTTVTPILTYLDRRSGRNTESAQLELNLSSRDPAQPTASRA